MGQAQPLIEIWRGPIRESRHLGHAVIWDGRGDIVAAWGDPEAVILPRSACKMIQGFPWSKAVRPGNMALATRNWLCPAPRIRARPFTPIWFPHG